MDLLETVRHGWMKSRVDLKQCLGLSSAHRSLRALARCEALTLSGDEKDRFGCEPGSKAHDQDRSSVRQLTSCDVN